MKVLKLDEAYEASRKKSWPKAFRIGLFFIGFMWLVFFIDFIFPFIDFNNHGIYPRNASHLYGIVTAVFLHGGLSHIISNTLPLLLAITALYGNYPINATKILIGSIVLTGFLVWIFARSANHIGASGLLYCLLAYLFVSGFIKKDFQSIGISIVLAFLYGSLIFGIIPDKQHISWESHLFGMLSGLFLAWLYRKKDLPIYKSWDEDN